MKYKKIALIFGITGQDGSYLSEYLLKKKYKVIGVVKKIKPNRNHKILKIDKKIKFQKCNYNQEQIEKIIKVSKCTEIYYLAGQPLPTISKKEFLETLNSNIYPVYYILNAILNINNKIKFFNASSCEIFKESKKKLNELSLKQPRNIYGLSKYISYEFVKFYRENFGLKVSSGIMFHHESLLRNKNCIFMKLMKNIDLIKNNKLKKINLGNLEIYRDWGWAPEYVKIMHQILNKNKHGDYVIATGNSVKLKKLVSTFLKLNNLSMKKNTKINKTFFRDEPKKIFADISKLKRNLKYIPSIYGKEIIFKLNRKSLF